MIPIYRLQEGMENIEKNKGTFKLCNDILKKGEVLLIFSEGNCVMEKRLRSLKKGTARIIFGAAESSGWNLDIHVIPVGINYAEPSAFRTELMVSVGEKLNWFDLRDSWLNEQGKAIRLFNERLYPALQRQMLIIPEESLDSMGENILKFGRNLFSYSRQRFLFLNSSRLKNEQSWLRKAFPEEDNQASFGPRIQHFSQATQKAGLPVESSRIHVKSSDYLYLFLGFIPAIMGAVIHIIPMAIAFQITQKKVRSLKFKSSVLFGTGALITYLWYIILFLFFLFFDYKLILLGILFPVILLNSLLWTETLQKIRWKIQHRLIKAQRPDIYSKWSDEKDQLLNTIQSS